MFWSLLPAAVLVASAWMFGAVGPPWSNAAALMAAGALGVALAVRRTRGRSAGAHTRDARVRWLWLIVVLYAGVQALNRSHDFSPIDKGLTPRAHVRALPSSVDGAGTTDALVRVLACAALSGLVGLTVADRRSARMLLYAVTASGGAMAVLALLQRMGPHEKFLYPLTGRFVGENHYAAYANLALPVTLALGRSEQIRARDRGAGSHPGYLLYMLAAVIVASVLACGSIAGMAVCGAIVCVWVAIELVRARPPWRVVAAGGAAVLVAGGLAVAAVGPEAVSPLKARGQLRTWRGQVATRAAVHRATLRMFGDRWLYGTGAGTFASAFPYYQPAGVTGFYRHAHDEYVQTLAEWGVVGTALLAALGAAMLRPRRSEQPEAQHPVISRTLWIGVALACGGVALHALVDFPMRSMAIAMQVVTWMTLLGTPPAEWES